MQEFNWTVRVYYEDTDAGGVVYHAAYLRFMERARTEWLRELGYSQHELRRDQSLMFTVTSISIDFRQASRIDDLLDVSTRLIRAGAASLVLEQAISRHRAQPVCSAQVTIACLDANTMKPRRLPQSLRTELEHVN